jgi:hypothetical protein
MTSQSIEGEGGVEGWRPGVNLNSEKSITKNTAQKIYKTFQQIFTDFLHSKCPALQYEAPTGISGR